MKNSCVWLLVMQPEVVIVEALAGTQSGPEAYHAAQLLRFHCEPASTRRRANSAPGARRDPPAAHGLAAPLGPSLPWRSLTSFSSPFHARTAHPLGCESDKHNTG